MSGKNGVLNARIKRARVSRLVVAGGYLDVGEREFVTMNIVCHPHHLKRRWFRFSFQCRFQIGLAL